MRDAKKLSGDSADNSADHATPGHDPRRQDQSLCSKEILVELHQCQLTAGNTEAHVGNSHRNYRHQQILTLEDKS